MRTPADIWTDFLANYSRKAEDDPEKMDFLMKTIKTVHDASVNPDFTQEDLDKHRSSADSFSRLVTPSGFVETKDFDIDEMHCQWVSPRFAHRKDSIILYCHGGGYISGGLGYAGILAAKLAIHTGLEVVSFEYRLAPEHPYPAAIEDGMSVWNYLLCKGYGAKNIFLAGDSAGGNLALELCLRLRAEERIMPRAMILMSPWSDLTCTSGSYKTYKDKDPLLTYEYIVAARNAYAGAEADFEDISYSPLLASMEKMPPTLIQVGSNEILRDDSEKLSKKITKAGGYARLEVYSGCWHVFQQMPIHKASVALDSVNDFVQDILS